MRKHAFPGSMVDLEHRVRLHSAVMKQGAPPLSTPSTLLSVRKDILAWSFMENISPPGSKSQESFLFSQGQVHSSLNFYVFFGEHYATIPPERSQEKYPGMYCSCFVPVLLLNPFPLNPQKALTAITDALRTKSVNTERRDKGESENPSFRWAPYCPFATAPQVPHKSTAVNLFIRNHLEKFNRQLWTNWVSLWCCLLIHLAYSI